MDPSMSVKRKVTVPVGRLGIRGLLLGKRAAIFKATFGGRLPGSSGRASPQVSPESTWWNSSDAPTRRTNARGHISTLDGQRTKISKLITPGVRSVVQPAPVMSFTRTIRRLPKSAT